MANDQMILVKTVYRHKATISPILCTYNRVAAIAQAKTSFLCLPEI